MSDRLRAIVLEAQKDVFRLAERDHGLTRKIVSSKANIGYDALGTYARGEYVMPLTELLKLCDVIPDYLLSYFFDPVGRHIVSNGVAADPLELIERGVALIREARAA